MRFLHTSDWHLGRSFHGAGLQAAHELYLDQLIEVTRSEGVDAVLVSGDIYDRAIPSPETVALLDDALSRLLDTGAAVIVTSGNHDSAVRLGFGARMLESAGLHIRSHLSSVRRPIPVGDGFVVPVPYLDPAGVADSLGATERTHAAVLRAALSDLPAGEGPMVAMAHTFVTGATSSDSERDISVGGLAAVPAAVFDQFDYAALGHLHRPQAVTDSVVYSGSPVAMSFSEADQVKGTELVTIANGVLSRETIAAPVERPVVRLRGPLTELLSSSAFTYAERAWCEVTLTDPTRPLGAMDQVRRRFPHTLRLQFSSDTVDLSTRRGYAEKVRGHSEFDVCCGFLSHVRGGTGASEQESELLRSALASAARVEREEASDDVVRSA
ncbi:exodeoxyribonuclease I subunit D [Branchiibius hedensis]|uniref:Nuclease SbcCD subunit D n=1 Tax=Branchiibius hedensis TaxID=672460 RepID=A0A2Y8ZR29_9MICO|nr:exonuclease SbcCD subunit D [Branchiibius hedensis]PWJ25061.1 exodeoxyribonuclease I subunit D [Branchiibius hedensis]SSA33876.1 Exodeoxyribonuclease I subunit D [Branchiibius hedensis]